MKQGRLLFLLCSLTVLLSGCATLAPEATAPESISQGMSDSDLQQMNLSFDTAKDGAPLAWHSSDGKTEYSLTTSNTYVNDQGEPCRSYSLLVSQSYHRKQTSTGIACRGDKDQWQLNSN